MGLAKRARLSAALTTSSELPPAADLSTIRIVRRDKEPASVIALADSRPAADGPARPAGDGMFYQKGSASAATFRPAYWTYERDPGQLAGPVASLERQLDARRRSNSPSPAPVEADPEEKPLASLDAAPALRKLAPSAEPSPPVLDPPVPTRHQPAELDTEAVEALLRPMPDAAAAPEEVRPTPVVVEMAPSTPAADVVPVPLAPSTIREEPAVLPAELSPPEDPPRALPVAPPPSVEMPVATAPSPPTPASVASEGPASSVSLAALSPPEDPPRALPVAPPPSVEEPVAAAPSPPASASVASESSASSAPPAAAFETEQRRPSAAPARKRPPREAAKPAEAEGGDFDALGATIDSVLASRWYGSERSGFTAPRVSRSDIAPVTPSTLIAELATVQKDQESIAAPDRGRRGRVIAAFFLVAAFALAFGAAVQWRTSHGSMLPTRLLPGLFGSALLPETTLVLADIHSAAPEGAASS